MTYKTRLSVQRPRPYGFLLVGLLKLLSSLQLTVVVVTDEVRVQIRPLPTPVVREKPPTRLPQ